MKIKFTVVGEIEVDKDYFDEGVGEAEIKSFAEEELKDNNEFYNCGELVPDSLKITTTISQ